jgi:RNA polymerase sigma factor (sigma-70 family)
MSEPNMRTMPGVDLELVVRIRRGDPDALRKLAETYGEPLRRIIAVQLRRFGMGRRRGQTSRDDLFQSEVHSVFNDAFLRFVKEVQRGRLELTDHQIIPYITRIATNLLTTQLRRPGNRNILPAESLDLPCPDDSTIDGLLADRELASKYLRLLTNLPEKCQRLISSRLHAGMTFAEIGAHVGMPENAARARYSECLARLRALGGDD